MTMRVTIKFFASQREALGRDSTLTELAEGSTAKDAFNLLSTQHPALRETAESIAFAVNREHVSGETPLHDGDELAFLPPVAGG